MRPTQALRAFSPFGSGHAAAGLTPRRRGRSVRRRRTPRAASARACSPPPRALAPPGSPGRDAHRLRRRPAMAEPERCAAASPAISRRGRLASPSLRHPAAAPPAPPCASPAGCPGCGRASPHRRRAVGGRQRRHRRGHGPGARPGQKQRSAPLPISLCQVGPTGQDIRGGFIYFC